MGDLIAQITGQLGVSDEQAKGGLGTILNFAKQKLSSGEFSQVLSALGGGGDESMQLAQAKTAGITGPGLGGGFAALSGGLGGLTGALGGLGGALGDAGKMATLLKGFEAFGMDTSTLTKFLPIVTSFLQQRGGPALQNILAKLV